MKPEADDEYFHRFFDASRVPTEAELVEKSREVWGGPARVLAHGLAVRAYPGPHKGSSRYTFCTKITPNKKLGFLGKKVVVREVVWPDGMEGVEVRDSGNYVSIPIYHFDMSVKVEA